MMGEIFISPIIFEMIKTNYSKYLFLPQFGTVINSEIKKDFIDFQGKLSKKDFKYLLKTMMRF
jgi:hypothetical protein